MSEQALDQSPAIDSETGETAVDNDDGSTTNKAVAETVVEKPKTVTTKEPSTVPEEKPDAAVSTSNREVDEASHEPESASTSAESDTLIDESNPAIPTSDHAMGSEGSEIESDPSTREMPIEDTLQTIDLTTTQDSNFLSRCFMFLDPIYESKYMLIFHILLLAMPISSGFMGARYVDECPLNSTIPTLLILLGIAGSISTMIKIVLISQKLMLPQDAEWQGARTSLTCSNMLVMIFFLLEMGLFFQKTPSFELGNAAYCNKIFYTFTYWINWSCLIVIILQSIVGLPHCPFPCLNTPLQTFTY